MKTAHQTAAIAAAILALGAACADAKPGDIIVGDADASEVIRVNPATGAKSLISDDPKLVKPNDSVFAPDGTLFVADYGAAAGTGAVFSINPRTGATAELAGGSPFEQPDGIARSPSGHLFVTDLDATADNGALFRVGVPGGGVLLVASGGGLVNAVGVVVPPNGRPIVAPYDTPVVVEVNPATGAQRTIANAGTGLTGAGGLVRAIDGTLYMSNGYNGDTDLEAIDPRTGNARVVATGFDTQGYGLAIDFQGRVLGVNGNEIFRANPRTGAVTSVADGFDYAEGLEVEPPRCLGSLATIVASTRNDRFAGSRFADVIAGLKGKDRINAKGGRDRVCGGPGNDRIKATQGRNRVDCGPGKRDVAIVNAKTKVRGCERVKRR